MWVTKLMISQVKKRIFCPKTTKFGPKLAFLVTLGQILAFFSPFRAMPNQITMQTRCLGDFPVMWVPKLLLSPVKISIFCPKTTKFGPKLFFWSFWARPCRLIWCPVGGLVGGYGARAVSRKPPIYFISLFIDRNTEKDTIKSPKPLPLPTPLTKLTLLKLHTLLTLPT